MSIFREKYKMGDVDFYEVRNRNEGRVIKALKEFLQTKGSPLLTNKDLHDIYALTLNALPPRYTQRGTIVLHDPVIKHDILTALEDAYDRVMQIPRP